MIGVEPEAAPTLAKALEAGKPVDVETGGIAADSLAAKRAGEIMFPLASKYVEKVVLVPDEAIVEAQVALWETLRAVAEPGGAVAFAALLSKRYKPEALERVGVVICGGNTTAVDFAHAAKKTA
jgi:threonine dehydratase